MSRCLTRLRERQAGGPWFRIQTSRLRSCVAWGRSLYPSEPPLPTQSTEAHNRCENNTWEVLCTQCQAPSTSSVHPVRSSSEESLGPSLSLPGPRLLPGQVFPPSEQSSGWGQTAPCPKQDGDRPAGVTRRGSIRTAVPASASTQNKGSLPEPIVYRKGEPRKCQ